MSDKISLPIVRSRAASRRRFLQTGCAGASWAFLASCATQFPGEFGAVKVIASGDAITFDVTQAQFAALASVGGMVAVDAGSLQLVLIRAATDKVTAFDRICPHAAADLGPDQFGTYDASTAVLTCNLHLSKFDSTGKAISGLAKGKSPLKSFVVTFDGTKGSVALA